MFAHDPGQSSLAKENFSMPARKTSPATCKCKTLPNSLQSQYSSTDILRMMKAKPQVSIPKTYPDGPGTPPVCYSGEVISEYGLSEIVDEFMRLSSKERRKSLRGSRNEDSTLGQLHFYKYRPLDANDKTSISKARSILVNDRIWAASSGSLNDPMDLRFKLIFNDDLSTRKKWIKENESLLAGMTPAQRLLKKQQLMRSRMTPEMEAGLRQDIERNIGVFCASATPRSSLMWAHYAAEHRGICIQFSPYEDELFLIAKKVTYSNTFPTLVVPSPPDATQEYYLQKSQDWAYEKEWRMVLPINDCSITLRPPAISAVILGARIERETIAAVMALLQERERLGKPPLKVYHAQLSDVSFDISIRSYCNRPRASKNRTPGF